MWLLESNTRLSMQQAYKLGAHHTAQQQIDYEARYSAASQAGARRILSNKGGTASIAVKGVLTNSPDFFAILFGGGNTTYSEIVSAITAAEEDADTKEIVLSIDSPGGTVDGLFDALAAIQAATKPVKAVISNVGTSAAYAIASRADEIVAANSAARIGSIGVAVTFSTDENEVNIASTEAPKKRPDVATQEGVETVREELDAIHQLFVETIAEGRKTTVDAVNSQFGRGATLLAGEALKRGMIDRIAQPVLKTVSDPITTTAPRGNNQSEAKNMDLSELKSKHPDTYAAAMQEGVDQERDRVSSFVVAGEASGDMKTALGAIKDGSEMTMTLSTQFMMAAANRRDLQDRQDDDLSANVSASSAEPDREAEASKNIFAIAAEKLGVELEGAHNA